MRQTPSALSESTCFPPGLAESKLHRELWPMKEVLVIRRLLGWGQGARWSAAGWDTTMLPLAFFAPSRDYAILENGLSLPPYASSFQ